MTDNARLRLLIVLLRLAGVFTAAAFLATLLPTDWMAVTHRALGLGEFPRTPIVDYLTRSISVLYGFHGVLLLVISGNVRRYSGIISYLAVMNVLLGLMLVAIDVHAGMPLVWTVAEGPSVLAFGIVIGVLNRSLFADGLDERSPPG